MNIYFLNYLMSQEIFRNISQGLGAILAISFISIFRIARRVFFLKKKF